MDITMYNMLFGDCFSIHNKTNLVVDFGIANTCDFTGFSTRYYRKANTGKLNPFGVDDIQASVADALRADQSSEFLLTHFHEDH
jgi:hypothetical protein